MRTAPSNQSYAAACPTHARSTSLRDIFAKVCADVQATLVLLDDEDD
jgi:hypothetical protein